METAPATDLEAIRAERNWLLNRAYLAQENGYKALAREYQDEADSLTQQIVDSTLHCNTPTQQ